MISRACGETVYMSYHIRITAVSTRHGYTLGGVTIARTTPSYCHIIHGIVVFLFDINTAVKYSVT